MRQAVLSFLAAAWLSVAAPQPVQAGLFSNLWQKVRGSPQAELCEAYLTREFPHVRQSTNYTCGPACMEAALRYWLGVAPSELELAEMVCANPAKGTTMKDLIRLATAHGLYAEEWTDLSIDEIKSALKNHETTIVMWDNFGVRHFSVVIGLDEKMVYLMDPSRPGPVFRIPQKLFVAQWYSEVAKTRGYAVRVSRFPLRPFSGQ